ncbi:sulfotransferase family protein [Parasphingorhabdus sp.]|uniref:sulfotransferase family protein n=1 Tax=Parasphingorhabdus sp. TaxID=2709688 RepID=UPI0030022EF8
MAAPAKSFHFISGLPRSGSTLTAAILRQNPRFHAGMSSPIAALFDNLISQVSAGMEISTMVSVEQRKRLLGGLFDSYYADRGEPVVFDTNRAWTAQLPALMQLFPDSKLICLVRDLPWIMDSLERLYRANPFEHTRLFNTPAERTTVYTRVDALAGANRLVGYPWHALREACYSDFAERLVIVEYDMITQRPQDVFKLLYDFLGEARFEHDFEGLDYDASVFDAQLGLDGLHRVRPKVEPAPRETILPPDLFERFSNMAFWRDLKGSKAFRIVSQPNATEQSGQTPQAATNSLPR